MDERREREIRNLISQGETIQAIKLYREATGAGLAHAKSAIEYFERTGSFEDPALVAETFTTDSPHCVDEVARLMRLNQRIAAVKFYREQTGSGLKEAKDAVERIAREKGIEEVQGSGCLGIMVLAMIMVAYCFA